MAHYYVTKRNGEKVLFDSERIKKAVEKAWKAADYPGESEQFERVIADIIKEVHAIYTDSSIGVEDIQDVVEKNLVSHGLYEVSKRYILYRENRAKLRDEKKKTVAEKAEQGRLMLRKKSGALAAFDKDKVMNTLTRAAADNEISIDFHMIYQEFVKNIYDEITTTELEKLLLLSTAAFIERDPQLSFVAAGLLIQRIYKRVIGKSLQHENFELEARKAFVRGIQHGVDNKIYDERLLSFDLDLLASKLDFSNDAIFKYIGVQTLYERYLVKTQLQLIETPQAFWMRVAMGLAILEKNREEKALAFYDLMSSLSFIPSTPTLFHAGLSHPQLSSCYLSIVNDDLTHIFKVIGDNAQLSKWSGGIGNDWTRVRATNAHIASTNVQSQGVVPFLKIANDTTVAINRSGKRRGATCAYLETWHLDIEDFLDLRRNTGDDRRRTHDMNTANWIPDLFMQRVQNGETWTLFSPDEVPDLHDLYGKGFNARYVYYEREADAGRIKLYRKVDALTLWRKMLTRLFETGHPWITFKDSCNIRSPQKHVGVIHNSNLCTEITLNNSTDETAVCNLGSLNLANHIRNNAIDQKRLAATIKTAVRMLDNTIDLNFYPTPEAENANLKHRPIALGLMGLQDALFKMRLPFEDENALEFVDATMEFIAYHAIASSCGLAQERGAYKSFDGSLWDQGIFPLDTLAELEKERGTALNINRKQRMDWNALKESVAAWGMRNSNVMAIAPTATISNIAGCFPSIEPIYKNIYVKANMSGEFTVVNDYLVKELKRIGLWTEAMLEQLKYYDGNINKIHSIPMELKALYKEVFEIDPLLLIKMTALRSKWIDQSQSHNVFMQGTSGKKMHEIYTAAWEMGLKTTYYLRTMAVSQIEKSTLDAVKYYFTQKRNHQNEPIAAIPTALAKDSGILNPVAKTPAKHVTNFKDIMEPDCEACT
ncbi:Ribonucleotide reductase of class Ia (aerobic), alpha subunit (EC [Olavius sp. associated proteobacterium Delta 1]|nr:Ribonucleotide reductase of class Ia (aerobic), alpha subunit (EC [Olavius sp. associated proteobacterium Delta 1]